MAGISIILLFENELSKIIRKESNKKNNFSVQWNDMFCGRTRKICRFTDKKIIRHVKKNSFDSANDTIQKLKLSVSENIVCRRLELSGLLRFRAPKKPFISPKNRKARIELANAHKHWTINDWKRVLWSNESKYDMKGPDGNLKVCRPKSKRLDPKYTKEMVKKGGGKGAMVWVVFLVLVELDLFTE